MRKLIQAIISVLLLVAIVALCLTPIYGSPLILWVVAVAAIGAVGLVFGMMLWDFSDFLLHMAGMKE